MAGPSADPSPFRIFTAGAIAPTSFLLTRARSALREAPLLVPYRQPHSAPATSRDFAAPSMPTACACPARAPRFITPTPQPRVSPQRLVQRLQTISSPPTYWILSR